MCLFEDVYRYGACRCYDPADRRGDVLEECAVAIYSGRKACKQRRPEIVERHGEKCPRHKRIDQLEYRAEEVHKLNQMMQWGSGRV